MARAQGHERGDPVSPCLITHFVSSLAVDAVGGLELKKFSVDCGRESTAAESHSSLAFYLADPRPGQLINDEVAGDLFTQIINISYYIQTLRRLQLR